MSDLGAIRKVFAQTLDEILSAQTIYQETTDNLDINIGNIRRQVVSDDDEIEQTLIQLLHRAEVTNIRSGRILSESNLHRLEPDHFNVSSNINTQQALDAMRVLVNKGEELLGDMEKKYLELNNERKKWWKFW